MMKNYLSHILPFFFALDLIIPFLLAPTYKGYSHLTQVMSVLGNFQLVKQKVLKQFLQRYMVMVQLSVSFF